MFPSPFLLHLPLVSDDDGCPFLFRPPPFWMDGDRQTNSLMNRIVPTALEISISSHGALIPSHESVHILTNNSARHRVWV
jgi:hypothetical protein